jgi:hypothetical protein
MLGVVPERGVTSSQLPPEEVVTAMLKPVADEELKETIWWGGRTAPCAKVKLREEGVAVIPGAV